MVSVANLSAFFLVVCFLQGSFAAPTAPPNDVIATDQSSLKLEQSIKQLATELEKTWGDLTKNSEWMYHHLQRVLRDILEKGFSNVIVWAFDFITRMELLFMADGSHFMFPLNGDLKVEEEYKTVAIAVSKLLRNLKTMQRTDDALTKVAKTLTNDHELPNYGLDSNGQVLTVKLMRTILHKFFENLDREMEADQELVHEYKKQKAEAQELVKQNPKMNEAPVRAWENSENYDYINTDEKTRLFLQDKVVFRQAIANKLFLKHSVKHLSMIFSQQEHDRYVMAKALLTKAHSSGEDGLKINEIYQRALQKAGELPVDSDEDAISDTLFDTIENALESEPELRKNIVALTKLLTLSTQYDTDMLRVDLKLL